MLIRTVCFIIALSAASNAVHYPSSQASDIEEQVPNAEYVSNKTTDFSEQEDGDHELEIDKPSEDIKDKNLLEDALKAVLDPKHVIMTNIKAEDNIETIIKDFVNENQTLDVFLENMDELSIDACKKSQKALWFYVKDSLSEERKKAMTHAFNQEDEVKKSYWTILKTHYSADLKTTNNSTFRRKIRIIKERAINSLAAESKERELIRSMQKIWNNALVCAYNSTCGPGEVRALSDIISTYKISNDSEGLRYYWKAFRDSTGAKIRPIFKKYVDTMNNISKSENFDDFGDLWRFTFDDDDFVMTVKRLWKEVKPLYNTMNEYVKAKLKKYYQKDMEEAKGSLPAHLLGNLWAQEWQFIFHVVTPYPDQWIDSDIDVQSRQLFEFVDEFFQSIGFPSFEESFDGIVDGDNTTAGCLPTSQDMCDGTFRIQWCPEREPVTTALPRAAKLLSRVQYATHYSSLPFIFRNGPTPAFPEAISNMVATQMTLPQQLKRLGQFSNNQTSQLSLNHLLWTALEKLPLMGYAYVLDSWRWDVFSGIEEDWNRHWWNLRVNETGISSPVSRNRSDLDPAAKYHVVSNVQYITYLVSQVLEFQILLALCRAAGHAGPLHQCSLYDSKDVGSVLRNGMALGSSESWRTVLQTLTNESEISTKGILEYFKPLEEFMVKENLKMARLNGDMDPIIPIIVGIIIVMLTIAIVIAYCVREKGLAARISSAIGISQNGSLDIAVDKVNEMSGQVTNKDSIVTDTLKEDKV